MPGRPKNNNRRREEHEKPKGKKMSKHGTIIVCSMCGNPGHNKTGCKKNPERGKKKNQHLVKTSKKSKGTEVNSFIILFYFKQSRVPFRKTANQFKPPRNKATLLKVLQLLLVPIPGEEEARKGTGLLLPFHPSPISLALEITEM